MPKIFLLDEQTACRIAAGEVVERPVSVVKELVENAIDADATSIDIEIYDGGIKKIKVTDNGCGISQEDVPLAFQRHATSKITNATDLESIQTLGFRGEALPGVAAVAKLTIKTRSMAKSAGYYIDIHGGQVQESGPAGIPVGTTVVVQDIFFNTPARRKHLKSKSTEGGLINDLVNKMALTNPAIKFTLQHNNREILRTPGTGKIIDAIVAVYGLNVAEKMVAVESQNNHVFLHGYIGKPELSRSTRQQITLAVNGRIVRCIGINQALDRAYRGLLTVGRFPVAVLLLQLPLPMVDVNVHPSKMEIKIDQEDQLATMITDSIQQSLQQVNLIPNYSSTKTNDHDLPATAEPYVLPLTPNTSSSIKGTETTIVPVKNQWIPAQIQEHQQGYEAPQIVQHHHTKSTAEPPPTKKQTVEKPVQFLPPLYIVGQLLQTFIAAEDNENIYLIDQHAAHERVLFEKYYHQLQSNQTDVQYLLSPITITLNAMENSFLQQHLSLVSALGFILEPFGYNSLLLRGLPIDTTPAQGQQMLQDLLDTLISTGKVNYDQMQYEAACMMACKAAVKGGDKMTPENMQTLIDLLSQSKQPYTCPHGRPTVITVSRDRLDRMFKRIQ